MQRFLDADGRHEEVDMEWVSGEGENAWETVLIDRQADLKQAACFRDAIV